MKRSFLAILAVCMGFTTIGMDVPMASVGTKRRPTQELEEIAPEAKEGRVEESSNYLFSQFPAEIQNNIRKYLDTAPGFGLEKLYNVAKNIRNLRLVSKADRDIIDNPEFIAELIQFLAHRYTNDNRTRVALALHTKSAADWLNTALLTEKQQTRRPEYRLLDKQVTNEIIDQLNQGHLDAAQFLLNASKVKNKNEYMVRFGYANAVNGDTLLHAAAGAGDEKLFKTIFSYSVPILDRVNNNEENALIIAISNNHTPIALALLQAGALPYISGRDSNGSFQIKDTALLRAASKNNMEVVQELLKRADISDFINVTNIGYPLTPIEYAVDHNNYPMFKALLEQNGVNLATSVLYKALGTNTQMVKDLVGKGIDVNREVKEYLRFSPFGVFEIDDQYGKTLLDDATTRDRLMLLIPHNLNINLQNRDGLTLLMNAVDQAKAKTVEALLDAGADVNIKDKSGLTAIDYAQDLEGENKDRIIKMLTDAAAKQRVPK